MLERLWHWSEQENSSTCHIGWTTIKTVALHDLVCAANLEANLEKDLDSPSLQALKESTTISRHSHPKASHVGPLLNSFLFSVAIVAAPAVALASRIISDLCRYVTDTSRAAADVPPNPQLSMRISAGRVVTQPVISCLIINYGLFNYYLTTCNLIVILLLFS